MRIQQLQLLKYGKFDDLVIDLPKAELDFHVIVGPNEAGKSTIRQAITELLFGMPLRTRLDFRHPLAELRLGGVLQSEVGELAFHRARGRTPLRTPADQPLAESQLASILGTLDKAFFEQMFCMDHDQLVEGGRSILDGSKDVGRVLFQSAAGISSLGPVREALDKQAGNLWTSRKASSAYALAVNRFEDASADLKAAQVRTKVWSDARQALDDIEQDIAFEENRRVALEAARSKFERVRRLGPTLIRISAMEAALAQLGDVIDLPATAQADLRAGGAELASAYAVLQTRVGDVEARAQERAAVSFDASVLSLGAEIEALDVMRGACANHARDLPLRQVDLDRLLGEARAAAAQLGWPADESRIRAGLPSTLALKVVGNLLRDRGALRQAVRSAEDAQRQKGLDIQGHRADLDGIAAAEVPPALREALAEALTFKNSGTRQRGLKSAVKQAGEKLGHALAALGGGHVSVDTLRTMDAPSTERVGTLQRARAEGLRSVAYARETLEGLQAEVIRLELAERQFEGAHKVVTPTDVHEARTRRDDAWRSLKSSEVPLGSGAPVLDAAIRLADELVDSQLGTATEAATLQNIRQQLELARAQSEHQAMLLVARKAETEALDADWQALAARIGWADMPLDDASSWLLKRADALAADLDVMQKQRELEEEVLSCDSAQDALARALEDSGVVVPEEGADLSALCALATRQIGQVDTASARRNALEDQVRQAERALDGLAVATETVRAAYQAWETQWTAALRSAKLEAAASTFAEAEGAVELANVVADRLNRADTIRVERINTMQADLIRFEEAARYLGARVDPPLVSADDWAQVARNLSQRLREATAASQAVELAEAALRTAQALKDEADLRVREARARLAPLLALAGVSSVAEALPLAERSDRRRAQKRELAETMASLLDGGDGLAREAIEAEVAAQPPAEVIGLYEQAKSELAVVNERTSALVQKRVTAELAFSAIAGQANAASAEARRQEALAEMGEVAEQYLEVATAGKLLKWAIDRYRDRKQGPMLTRASAVFSDLTLGDYSRLGVDYEKDTPALYARRRTGQVVEVAGLSEGTRDQLYLALRVAALELHLAHAGAVPFVADDLFVNFDDARAKAGLRVLAELSKRTQVLFLTHHSHLLPLLREALPGHANVIELQREMPVLAA